MCEYMTLRNVSVLGFQWHTRYVDHCYLHSFQKIASFHRNHASITCAWPVKSEEDGVDSVCILFPNNKYRANTQQRCFIFIFSILHACLNFGLI